MKPRITIVTPSYNQGRFLEDTILSVIGQNYPNLEYMIIDGGSSDNSVEIIQKYEQSINFWVSEKDTGQANAINKGFSRATGDILMWLNSDDMLMPNVLQLVAKKYLKNSNVLYFGNCLHFRLVGDALSSFGSNVSAGFKNNPLSEIDFIIQPSSFWSKEIWENTGLLRDDLHFGFDWEWFLRVEQKYPLIPIEDCISLYRIHDSHKTGTGGLKRQQELLEIYEVYNPKMAILYKNLMDGGMEVIENYNTLKYRIKRKLGKETSFFQKAREINNGMLGVYPNQQIRNAISML
jgi:glycosyltransferase involved in cell wall biosynthesis